MLALRILKEIREEIVRNDGSVDELCEIGQAITEVRELIEKAKKYDELIDLGEKEAKEKSIEILKDFSKLGFLGHDIKTRESF